jgi:hypothetical protein
VLNSSEDRLVEIEKLEDDLDEILESLDDDESKKFIRRIIVDLLLSSTVDLDDSEKGYLLAEELCCSKIESDEKIEQLHLSVKKKLKDSIQPGKNLAHSPPIHWIHRLIYLLVSKEPTPISDQMELIFNAIDFCNLPLEAVRKKIEARLQI